VLDSARYHNTLSGPHGNHVIPELDAEISLPHEEQFVLVFVMVPGELALHFDDLEFLAVQSSNDFGPPMFSK
jgi:hypothetical protein